MTPTSHPDILQNFLLSLPLEERQYVIDTLIEYPDMMPLLIQNIQDKYHAVLEETTTSSDSLLEKEKELLLAIAKKYA